MVGFSTEDLTVTTWGTGEGPDAPQRWRARGKGGRPVVEFFSPRDTPLAELLELAARCLAAAKHDPSCSFGLDSPCTCEADE